MPLEDGGSAVASGDAAELRSFLLFGGGPVLSGRRRQLLPTAARHSCDLVQGYITLSFSRTNESQTLSSSHACGRVGSHELLG